MRKLFLLVSCVFGSSDEVTSDYQKKTNIPTPKKLEANKQVYYPTNSFVSPPGKILDIYRRIRKQVESKLRVRI